MVARCLVVDETMVLPLLGCCRCGAKLRHWAQEGFRIFTVPLQATCRNRTCTARTLCVVA
jgi:hypothetical protein